MVRYVRNECWLFWDLPCASNNTTPLQHTSDTCESTMERRARTRDTNKGFLEINRLPRPRRPPPRLVLRQAGGPEGRGSWSDLEVEQQPQTEEAARAGWEFGRRKKVWCDLRKGWRRERGLYYRAAANRRARCTYTATPKHADDDGREGSIRGLDLFLNRARVWRKWRLVLFFCPALSGFLLDRLDMRF